MVNRVNIEVDKMRQIDCLDIFSLIKLIYFKIRLIIRMNQKGRKKV